MRLLLQTLSPPRKLGQSKSKTTLVNMLVKAPSSSNSAASGSSSTKLSAGATSEVSSMANMKTIPYSKIKQVLHRDHDDNGANEEDEEDELQARARVDGGNLSYLPNKARISALRPKQAVEESV